MRILLLNGNTTEEMTRLCADTSLRVCHPDTKIKAVTATEGPQIITTRTENAMAIGSLLAALGEHVAEADGVIVAVSFDTAIDALREASPVPVIGMTEAALHVAALLGGQIGVIGPGARALNVYRETIQRSGLRDRVIGIQALDLPPAAYLSPEVATQDILVAAHDLIAQGAESIVLAGAAMAGMQAQIDRLLPVPVVEGIAAATVLVEALVRLAPTKPKAGSLAILPARSLVGSVGPVKKLFAAIK